jgi:hypothetical protein
MTEERKFECTHDKSDPEYVCPHMLEKITYQQGPDLYIREHLKWFTGKGVKYRLVCSNCAKLEVDQRPENVSVCKACFRELEQEGGCGGKTGDPEFLEAEAHLKFDVSTVKFYNLWTHLIADIQPLYQSSDYNWLVTTASGSLIKVPARVGSKIETVANLGNHVDFTKPVLMRVSPNERFLAIANTYGQSCCVVDLIRNVVAHKLSRDTYHIEHCIFPLSFFVFAGKDLLVHGTQWNRLDVTDPETGELLTRREYAKGAEKERPPHYLDYFHGLLTVSPGNDLVVDNGWVWHPVGIPVVFSLNSWLSSNVWESEDGASRKHLDFRDYSWPTPICWIDEKTVALSGFGGDDLWIIPAAQFVDTSTGKTLRWFAGPEGEFFFDEYLFASSEKGFTGWNIETGERILNQPSFHPVRYHRRTKEFLSILSQNRLCVGQVFP